jgi:hypothetical protein
MNDPQSLEKLISIYENLQISINLSGELDGNNTNSPEGIKAELNSKLQEIEGILKDVVAYYKNLKSRATAVPTDEKNLGQVSIFREFLIKNFSWACKNKPNDKEVQQDV